MTTVADKLYNIYEQNGIISSTNSDGFNVNKISLDNIFQEALDIFNSTELLSEGIFDSVHSLIGKVKSKTDVKNLTSKFEIKNEKDLKRIEALTKKYENKLPSEEQIKKKLFKLNEEYDNVYHGNFNNLATRIRGWIGSFFLLANPLTWIVLLIVMAIAKSSGKKYSDVWKDVKIKIKQGVKIKDMPGTIPTAIKISGFFVGMLGASVLTFGLLLPVALGAMVLSLLIFWVGVFGALKRAKKKSE